MNDHSIADGAALQYGHIGVNGDIVADDHMVADNNSRMKPDLIPDSNLITDDHHGADGNILAAFKFFSDHSTGVCRTAWLCWRMKILHHLCKSHHGIVDLNEVVVLVADIPRDKDRRGIAICHLFEKLGAAGHRNFIYTGQLKGGRVADHSI